MKNRTRVFWGLLLLVLIALAGGQADRAEARDSVYIGADLDGLVMAFNSGPRYQYLPAPYVPPRVWHHHDHYYPPPVVYGRPHYRAHRGYWGPPPRHHWREDHWRGDRW